LDEAPISLKYVPAVILMEVWIEIEGWPCYQVSNQGRVRSLDKVIIQSNGVQRFSKGVVLNPWKESGYFRVDLSNDNEKQPFFVHTLVCTVFHGPCPEGLECRHLDGNEWNNLPDNLMWGTRKQNAEDAVRHRISNPIKRANFQNGNHAKANREKAADPEFKEKLRQAALRRWSDPSERQKQSQRTSNFYKNKK
jgi:HNH endonuclease/NUMOD4 motif